MCNLLAPANKRMFDSTLHRVKALLLHCGNALSLHRGEVQQQKSSNVCSAEKFGPCGSAWGVMALAYGPSRRRMPLFQDDISYNKRANSIYQITEPIARTQIQRPTRSCRVDCGALTWGPQSRETCIDTAWNIS